MGESDVGALGDESCPWEGADGVTGGLEGVTGGLDGVIGGLEGGGLDGTSDVGDEDTPEGVSCDTFCQNISFQRSTPANCTCGEEPSMDGDDACLAASSGFTCIP